MTRTEIVETARKYIGVKYLLYGRSPILGLDCWGFFMNICRDLNISCSGLSKNKYKNLLNTVLRALHYMKFAKKSSPKQGDILVRVFNPILAGHIAIITKKGIIHSMSNGVRETKILGIWRYFEFPGVN